jgi:hypothetical protein
VSEDIPGGQENGGPTEIDILRVVQYNYQRKKDKNDEYKQWTTKYYTEN